MKKTLEYPLQILQFDFSSPLADIVIELNNLRQPKLFGDTPS